MKKNISINIAGIIFHIEEDGYEILRKYLDSIKQYFARFEDSHEIVSDIENRIAEIFLSKLKEGKQVITHEDVQELMTTMGNTEDFKSMEESYGEEPFVLEAEEEAKQEEYQEEKKHHHSGTKKLYRDTKRNLLGGVASGIAHYFGIDAIWIRLLFIVLFFDIFFTYSIAGILFLGYIICWIVIPGNDHLEEDKKIKKLYRDPDSRVIGGVASGIAAYFGTDTALIRILFLIALIPGGFGFFAYVILWIITPVAETITEKMQMKGEPVTLHNIEGFVKKNLQNQHDEEESVFVKILLFPFRLLSRFFSWLGTTFGSFFVFLMEAIRIVAGVLLVISGLGILVALVFGTGVFFGFFTPWFPVVIHEFPLAIFQTVVPGTVWVFGSLSILIPSLFVMIAGLSLIAKRWLLKGAIGWSMLAIYVIVLFGLGYTVPRVIAGFSKEGEYVTTQDLTTQGKIVRLGMQPMEDDAYHSASLKIRGYEGPNMRLEKTFKARGKSRSEAEQNAHMVSYTLAQPNDSTLLFDEAVKFNKEATFRVQHLDMTLFVPYGQQFTMDESLASILSNTLYPYGYDEDQMQGNIWQYDSAGLHCVTCVPSHEGNTHVDTHIAIPPLDIDINIQQDDKPSGHFSKTFTASDFNAIEAGHLFYLHITQGDHYSVKMVGKEKYVERAEFQQHGDRIELSYDEHWFRWFDNADPVHVYITMPELRSLDLDGAAKAVVGPWKGEDLYVNLDGASQCEFAGNLRSINVDQDGATHMTMRGIVHDAEIEIDGASSFSGYDCRMQTANVDLSGISKAELNVEEELEGEVSGASHVKYVGQPRLIIDATGASSVEQQ